MHLDDTHRTCTACSVVKPSSQYHLRKKNGKTRLDTRCKDCVNGYATKWRRAKPSPPPEANLAKNLRNMYGLTPTEFEQMRDSQGGVCAICGQPPSGDSQQTRRLSVDHCHVTGRVRGLVCTHCNRGLSGFQDTPLLLLRAIGYLLRSRRTAP